MNCDNVMLQKPVGRVHGYGNFESIDIGADIKAAEAAYERMYWQAKEFCKRAGADIRYVEMIVKFARADMRHGMEKNFGAIPSVNTPIMTVGWKIHLDEEQNAKLKDEDVKELCEEIFYKIRIMGV